MADPSHYFEALNSPFDPRAKGARIPDLHAFPTCTYNVTTQFTVSCIDGSGNIDFMVTPSPTQSIIVSANAGPPVVYPNPVLPSSLTGQNVFQFGDSLLPKVDLVGGTEGYNIPNQQVYYKTPPPPAPTTVLGGNYNGCYGGATTEAALSAVFDQYRVVGYGFRVRSVAKPLNQQGQLIMCCLPTPDIQPDCSTSTLNDWLEFCKYPNHDESGCLTSAMLQFPTSDVAMYAELLQDGGLEWSNRITGPQAFTFRRAVVDTSSVDYDDGSAVTGEPVWQTGDNTWVISPIYLSDDIQINGNWHGNAGNDSITTRSKDMWFTGGHSSFFLRGTGLCTGTDAVTPSTPYAVFVVEIIYHLEGTPNVTNSALIANTNIGYYQPALMDKALMANSREHWYRRIVDYDKQSGHLLKASSNAALGVSLRAMAGVSAVRKPRAKKRKSAVSRRRAPSAKRRSGGVRRKSVSRYSKYGKYRR